MKKRIAIIGGLVVAVGIIGAVGWYIWNRNAGGSDEQTAYVTTVSTLMGDISGTQNRYAGIVEPQQTVNIKVDSGRTIGELRVEAGQSVKKGDVLFTYDASATQDDLAKAQLDLDRYKNEATSLENRIATLNADKARASADEQLSYSIEIQTQEMDLKKNEYNQKSKEAEIEKLQEATQNLEVQSDIDGVVRTVNESLVSTSGSSDDDGDSTSSGSSNFITIVATGNYRVKGTINETNMSSIVAGDPVIIRSRVDSDLTWKGTMTGIDTEENQSESNSNADSFMDSSGNSESSETTQSSTYPFYVELESTDGLILGQHVYIEMDNGQSEVKEGIWLDEYYIVDADTENPYVWASNSRDRLEKRSVTLGELDEELGKYEITEGLTKEDCIAFPDDTYEEGMPTSINDATQVPTDASLDSGLDSDANLDSDVSMDSDANFDSDIDSDSSLDSDSSFDSDSGEIETLEEGGEPL